MNVCWFQPYRTTPLILPGAKVKKEVVPNECYLRHHPNPSMRGRAPHVDDFLLRQRVRKSKKNFVIHVQKSSFVRLSLELGCRHSSQSRCRRRFPNWKGQSVDILSMFISIVNNYAISLGRSQAIQLSNWTLLGRQYRTYHSVNVPKYNTVSANKYSHAIQLMSLFLFSL